ncbi:hypothetical protein [Moraxella bovis]|uniref:Uncharacterized protein n=1 Tax=Moraxella bovis TaxID=476 RepID=A0A378PXY0_MORBO|nr:hypothetical protein [Moraxella bovis]UZA28366.1 hypothetical protein LP119_05265 [Moraxella bovis]UZA39111.1 hypothetical protein LP101_06110 [Moraxella bovis]STY93390.1 Uncharacterised protein [Moraxella bovis]
MSEVKFKVGDLVYYLEYKEICKIVNVFSKNIVLDVGKGKIKIRVCIPTLSFFGVPASIFHATQENYELLSKLYPNVTFEPPPKRKEPREIIKAMLKAGYDGVPCKTDCKQYRFVCVNVSDDPYFPFVYDSLDNDDAFSSAIPYCYQTGKTIIDFVDGEVVLED